MVLLGFTLVGSLELVIPADCSLTLHTVACPSRTSLSLSLGHEERLVAVLSESGSTTSLQYPLTPADSPVVIQTDALCHVVASLQGATSLDSLMLKKEGSKHILQVENAIHAAKEPSIPERKSNKRRLSESKTDAPSKTRDLAVEEESTEECMETSEEVILSGPPIVVAAPRPDNSKRKRWRVRPEGDSGVLVPSPRQVIKSSGVVVTDYIVGKKAVPRLGSKVRVIYQAMFPEGKVFDEHLSRKQPFVFRLGAAQVIRGLDLGMEGMRIGGAREIVIPSELGYVDNLFILYVGIWNEEYFDATNYRTSSGDETFNCNLIRHDD